MLKGSGENDKMDGLFYKCFTKRYVPQNSRNGNGISWKLIGYWGPWMICEREKFKTGHAVVGLTVGSVAPFC